MWLLKSMTAARLFIGLAWVRHEKENRLRIMNFHVPSRRVTVAILATIGLLVALVITLVVIHPASSGKRACVAEVVSGSVTAYLVSKAAHTAAQCASAAVTSGNTNLPSLPTGLTEICATSAVLVYQPPEQVSSLKSLGLNPAEICPS